MIDKFDEHKGPVRGLDFHKHQPIFVSGGDDGKIKVWNYKSRKCLFTLDAHEDYIRTTFFHNEHPWILSASDDQSIRIWNWQSRSRIAVLTGHTHYVMCAQFHPSLELILSASIDQTLRLWDITGLKMKKTSSSMTPKEEALSAGLPEILSKTDYSVESKDAHNQEINWCSFHPEPKKLLCLSTADDHLVKLWKLEVRGGLREIDTFRGHYNNVSGAIFHPRKDFIISCSEDRSIRVWDLDKKTALSTYRKDIDRFWAIAAHPRENLFAAGHDTGFMLFKLERERPAFTVVKDYILFIKGNHLYKYNMVTSEKNIIATLKPKTELLHCYNEIDCYSFDPTKSNQVLISIRSSGRSENSDKSIYDLYKISGNSDASLEPDRNPGRKALFIGPNRIAIHGNDKKVLLQFNLENPKHILALKPEDIYKAGPGRLLMVDSLPEGKRRLYLWDLETSREIKSITLDFDIKKVIMSGNKNYVACICSDKIVICDGQLNVLSKIQENRKIKSAVWEESGVLFYSTPVHVKYALTDGEVTTIVSIPQVLYIMAVRDDKIMCIDRNGDVKQIRVDSREFKFKQAVVKNERGAILSSLRQLGSLTRAEIAFLVKRGHPGLALKFVDDDATRFPLALQAFDIDEALQAAIKIDRKECWKQLAEAAMLIGHVKAAEKAYWQLKEPYELAMLYLVADQRDKMIEARSLARDLGDTSTEFMISLLVKDLAECARIMHRCGHANLAYSCAVNHGLYDLASDIAQDLSEHQLAKLPTLDKARTNVSWMDTTTPDIGNSSFDNWPLLNDEQDNFETVLADEVDTGDWEDDEFRASPDLKAEEEEDKLPDEGDDEGWQDEYVLEDLSDDEDLEDGEEVAGDDGSKDKKSQFIAPNVGQSITSKWIQHSDLALHHVLAGSYKTACSFLQSQVGVVDIEPLRVIYEDLVLQSRTAYVGLNLYPTMYIHPIAEGSKLPAGGYMIEDLEKRLIDCYALFSSGKFADAIDSFRNLLLCTLFMQFYAPDSKSTIEERENRAKEIISISREYILGLQIWLERKNITGKEFQDHKRACELAAYFARLNLPKHRTKILEKAFEVFLVKPKDFQKTRAAASIARRLLDYITSDPKKAKMAAYAEKVKSSYDAQIDLKIQLDYDELNPYSLCAAEFKPIFSGFPLVSCPFCDAKYQPQFSGEACKICLVSQIGKSCTGIRFKPSSLDNLMES